MTWTDGPMVGFDCETTGVDTERDLILSASVINIPRTAPPAETTEYLLHPGLTDPPGGYEIHKISLQFLKENGADPAETLEALCQVLSIMVDEHTPLVGMNVPFDLTMLDRNCRLYGVAPLTDRCQIFALDAFVLDKAVDPYRKGSRKLEALANQYRIPWDAASAHGSAYDAFAAARVVWRIGRLYPALGSLTVPQLHQLQVEWKQKQDASFAEYLRKNQKPTEGVDGRWPIRPLLPSNARL
jgi:DNA polymerase-3 subunit epsilon